MRAAVQTLLLLFLLTLLAYATAFTLIENHRTLNGPWRVTFTSEAGVPEVVINQTKLKIQNLKLTFPGAAAATNAPQTLAFDSARPVPFAVPAGQCVFLDTLWLPGTVTLKLYGHEIQLLPRVLTVDKQERPWRSDAVIPLPALVR